MHHALARQLTLTLYLVFYIMPSLTIIISNPNYFYDHYLSFEKQICAKIEFFQDFDAHQVSKSFQVFLIISYSHHVLLTELAPCFSNAIDFESLFCILHYVKSYCHYFEP